MDERAAAQFLANVLADCYTVQAVAIPTVWERYGRFMQSRWMLTKTETLVAVECIKGCTNEKIAEALSSTAETVKKHLDSVYAKAGVHSRSEFSALLLQEFGGLISHY